MIIPDFELKQWALNGGLSPFDSKLINPASVDLRWSGLIKRAWEDGWEDEFVIGDTFRLEPGSLYLTDTLEYIKVPTCWAGQLMLKSSMGRNGLEHLHAGWFDPGFEGTGTLELYNASPWWIPLKIGQPIVQISFLEMKAIPEKPYNITGRYNGQVGPTEAR